MKEADERRIPGFCLRFRVQRRLLLAGTDFFTAEVLTFRGLTTYYVLCFIHLESRKVDIAGITVHPNYANRTRELKVRKFALIYSR